MRRYAIAGSLLLFSASAWSVPLTFQGTYDVNVNTADPGLVVNASPTSGSLNFDLGVGDYTWESLFHISTDETAVNSDDKQEIAASIDFDFTLPEAFGGEATGETSGNDWLWGAVQWGELNWDQGGHFALNFGNGGLLDIYLQDATFDKSVGGLYGWGTDVYAKFELSSAPISVPQPASLTLLGAGLLGMGAMVVWRRRRVL